MITIITACSRPENLQAIKESITFPCAWIIVYDSDIPIKKFDEPWIEELNTRGGVVGSKQKNLGIEFAHPSDFIYFLDDDNLIHDEFYELYNLILKSNYLGYIFSQNLGNGTFRVPEKENIKVCHVDLAQYLINKILIKNTRFLNVYECDGYFIEEIYKRESDKILVTEKVYSYYNRLKWTK